MIMHGLADFKHELKI